MQTCETLLAANTMAQRDPAGGYVVFLHSNLNKWTLDLPDKWVTFVSGSHLTAGS
jgi:hypothetical protein